MPTAFVVENDARDAESLRKLLTSEGVEPVVLATAEEAEQEIARTSRKYDLAFLTWDVSNLLLTLCRHRWPSMPVVIVSGSLDISIARVAQTLGAKKFLDKPVDASELRDCIRTLLTAYDPWAPQIARLRRAELGKEKKQFVGKSPEFVAMLRKLAAVLEDKDSAVLITGESGTGKELVALAVVELGKRSGRPWRPVNVAAIPATLIESELFGQERGAFTDARDRKGLLEEAGDGTLFLDEIGELHVDLQAKLLRVIQEKVFRRVGGNTDIPFEARLIFATNKNMAEEVNAKRFRSDLFHRIAERQVHVPALRERTGDMEVLIDYFLRQYGGGKKIVLARATEKILLPYSFPGNIRELEKMIKTALKDPLTRTIHPEDLELETMDTLLKAGGAAPAAHFVPNAVPVESGELLLALPSNYLEKPYEEARALVEHAFDRVYLPPVLKRAGYRWDPAAKKCGLTVKTFKNHWKDCGLPPLTGGQEDSDG